MMSSSVMIRLLKLFFFFFFFFFFFAVSVSFNAAANIIMFNKNLRVRLSLLKSPILRKYTDPFKRGGMYPSISEYNVKRCRCCLCIASIVSSSVNGRRFSVDNNSDLDWKSTNLIDIITGRAVNCGMQYVGQTNGMLIIRFNKHYRTMNKPKRNDDFLYHHFKRTDYSLNDISIQQVEKK